jgi:hypothetical protein
MQITVGRIVQQTLERSQFIKDYPTTKFFCEEAMLNCTLFIRSSIEILPSNVHFHSPPAHSRQAGRQTPLLSTPLVQKFNIVSAIVSGSGTIASLSTVELDRS